LDYANWGSVGDPKCDDVVWRHGNVGISYNLHSKAWKQYNPQWNMPFDIKNLM
jgi:hypothetical protein